MSSLTTLARPYAKAAFELAQSEENLPAWDDMLTLASEMVTEKSMAVLLESPHISNEEVVKILTETAGDAFTGRLFLLPQVTSLFRKFREEAENRLSVKVVSAVPLTEEQAGRLREALSRRMESEIELDNEIDKNVIGGAVIYAGDQVIDGSLRGRLEKLSTSLAN